MPSKTSKKKPVTLPTIPKELIDQFADGPMTAEAVNAASMAFKKALIERALVDAFVDLITDMGAEAVIPPRSNRRTAREYDRERYKARNLVEPFFNRLKQFRRLATRYDKLANRFNAFLHVACAYIWLL
ncbi:MAG: transposase [Rhodocyclales bacterium]|nr:transposase [Rhodocyclales bacterium]